MSCHLTFQEVPRSSADWKPNQPHAKERESHVDCVRTFLHCFMGRGKTKLFLRRKSCGLQKTNLPYFEKKKKKIVNFLGHVVKSKPNESLQLKKIFLKKENNVVAPCLIFEKHLKRTLNDIIAKWYSAEETPRVFVFSQIDDDAEISLLTVTQQETVSMDTNEAGTGVKDNATAVSRTSNAVPVDMQLSMLLTSPQEQQSIIDEAVIEGSSVDDVYMNDFCHAQIPLLMHQYFGDVLDDSKQSVDHHTVSSAKGPIAKEEEKQINVTAEDKSNASSASTTVVSATSNQSENDVEFIYTYISAWFGDILTIKNVSGEWIDSKDVHGNTALAIAVRMEMPDVAHALLEKGADPRVELGCGWNILQEACLYQQQQLVTDMVIHTVQLRGNEYEKQKQRLLDSLQKIKDFKLEIKWQVTVELLFVSQIKKRKINTIKQRQKRDGKYTVFGSNGDKFIEKVFRYRKFQNLEIGHKDSL
ncbi:hypothetical protein RFI_14466 [Reticulomyxa filosa]|uniref:Uncharacterized protein n=1 Tax=Reticulomyxa filosa TaxID=46433 RepID=X6NBM4_RETFI|nr:hypothetical protein RFI_14466 [Reticulomyxa filosa]|eukprot:ETO22727.1 hypothetical protein RFI_14466 [Reticulomyxa filosa]